MESRALQLDLVVLRENQLKQGQLEQAQELSARAYLSKLCEGGAHFPGFEYWLRCSEI